MANMFDHIKPGESPLMAQERNDLNTGRIRPIAPVLPRITTPKSKKTNNEELLNSLLEPPQKAIGEDLFLVNAFPIKKEDNILMKGLKGLGNFALSTVDAPFEGARKLAMQGGSVLSGQGLQKDLPKNTSFTQDILPQGVSSKVNQFKQSNPVLGGLTEMGLNTIADPSTFLGAGVVKNTANRVFMPELSQGLLKHDAVVKNTTPKVVAPPQPRAKQPKVEIPLQPKQTPTTSAQQAKIAIPKTMSAEIDQPQTISSLSEGVSEPFLKNRQFTENSVLNSQVAPDIIKQELKENLPQYEQLSNKVTFDNATAKVSQNYTKAIQDFTDAKGGVNADDVALGEALISKAIREGNTDQANMLIADLAEKLTTAGQAVQAASIFKRLTPEGMLLYAQRMINRANRDLFDRLGKKAQKIILTSDDSEFILDTMKNVQKLPEGRERDVELAKVMARISNKVPATLGEKAKGLQRISMLLNPKTMGRNIFGNLLFGAVDNLSNSLATPLDIATSKLTGKRTTTLPSFTTQLNSAMKGAKETIEDARLGIDTYPTQTQYELPNKRIFDTEFLNKLDKATKVGLQFGDRPFYQAAFDDSLRQQMKLAKVSEPTQDMIDQATKVAKERTYQDANKITQAADGLRDAFNKLGGKNFGAGNVIIPFTKTPANILKRAIEYSPVGLEKAVRESINLVKKNGKFDQKGFVDSIARSTTGTGLVMAGYALAEKGILTGTGNKDKDIASFERNLGKSDFAVKIDDKYFTYDWAQPLSISLAIGADMYIKGMDKKEAENAVIEGIKSGGETLLKQSFLQGVQRLFGGYAPMDNIEQTAYNAPAQFIPTLSNQFAQLTDQQKRSTYGGSVQQNAINSIKAKIPGVSKSLEPSLDTFGKPIQQYQGKNNPLNVFLNPARTTTFNPTPTQAEILRVYESTGNKNVFPKVAPRSFTNKGETITLTPKEITTMQKAMGEDTEARMNYITDQNIADEMKAKLMVSAIEQAYERAKKKILEDREKAGK